MTLSAAQAAAFVSEATQGGFVWAIRDDGGYPAPADPDGKRAMPFWSKESRALKIIHEVKAYRGFRPEQMELATFLRWLPELEKDGLLIGLNWYGKRAIGYNLAPSDVLQKFGVKPPAWGLKTIFRGLLRG